VKLRSLPEPQHSVDDYTIGVWIEQVVQPRSIRPNHFTAVHIPKRRTFLQLVIVSQNPRRRISRQDYGFRWIVVGSAMVGGLIAVGRLTAAIPTIRRISLTLQNRPIETP
jgi:hypothetical protein